MKYWWQFGNTYYLGCFNELRYSLSKVPTPVYDDNQVVDYLQVILSDNGYEEILKSYSLNEINTILSELLERNKIWHFYTDDTYKNRRRNANIFISNPEVRKTIFHLYGKKCLLCGSNNKIHLDHIVPVASGGQDCIDNLQPLCYHCNISKGTKTIDYRV